MLPLLSLFSGAGVTSGLFCLGNKNIINQVTKNIDEARELLEKFGKSLELTEVVAKNVIRFVMKHVYNDKPCRILSSCLETNGEKVYAMPAG